MREMKTRYRNNFQKYKSEIVDSMNYCILNSGLMVSG